MPDPRKLNTEETENLIKALQWCANEEEFVFAAQTMRDAADAITALREKQEREKGCVWCKEDNKIFHDGQHFHLFCSYCGKRLEK